MELTILADALRRASVKSITAIIPYYGYSRQDRRVNSARVPISARLVADFIRCSGIKRILTIDLHSEQIQGFFDIPVDNVYASNIMVEDIKKTQKNIDDIIVVSPDIGGVQRARAVAKQIDAELAIIDKRRPMENKAEVMHVIGEVKNKVCLIVDDIIDTGGTLIQAAKSLKERGSKKVVAYITHPILSKDAAKNINDSEYLDELVVTDTISLSKECDGFKSIRQITSATLLAECILRINSKKSISEIM
jgi:ribose-phosphate pyrophosphokinase